MKFYHVTSRRNMYSIMHNGLIPKHDPHMAMVLGPHSRVINLAGSHEKAKYFEALLLQADEASLIDPVILEIDGKGLDIRRVSKEWYYTTHKIPPDRITYDMFR